LIAQGTPCCSQTCAIALVAPDSKAPTRMCAPSRISFSACVRATSGLDSVSAFIQLHRMAHAVEDRHRGIAAALAGLALEREKTRARQQHADLERLGGECAPAQQRRRRQDSAGRDGAAGGTRGG